MLVVETLAKIRRDRLVHGKSIRAIAKTRGVSRNTVRKVLRSDETSLEPVYHRRKQPRPKLGQYEALLEALLLSNHQAPRHDRLNFLKMFELLRDDGYRGGYDAVRRYARLKPLLFEDDDPDAAEATRTSVVAPAEISPTAKDKAQSKQTAAGLPVHRFRTLLDVHLKRSQ